MSVYDYSNLNKKDKFNYLLKEYKSNFKSTNKEKSISFKKFNELIKFVGNNCFYIKLDNVIAYDVNSLIYLIFSIENNFIKLYFYDIIKDKIIKYEQYNINYKNVEFKWEFKEIPRISNILNLKVNNKKLFSGFIFLSNQEKNRFIFKLKTLIKQHKSKNIIF